MIALISLALYTFIRIEIFNSMGPTRLWAVIPLSHGAGAMSARQPIP
jgi:hypothetical protein